MKTNKSIVEYFGIALQTILSIIVIVIMILFSKDDPWLPYNGFIDHLFDMGEKVN